MGPSTKHLVFGVVLGCMLSVIGFLAAGFGHGSYVPIGVASAPFGVLGQWAAVFAPPLLWGLLFRLSCQAADDRARKRFLIMITVHYGAAIVLALFGPYSDWNYIQVHPAITRFSISALILYALTQCSVAGLQTIEKTDGTSYLGGKDLRFDRLDDYRWASNRNLSIINKMKKGLSIAAKPLI